MSKSTLTLFPDNNPYKFTDPDRRFGLIGAGIGAGIEFGVQMATAEGSFTQRLFQVDLTDIAIAGAVGAVTGGISGRLATRAAQGAIRTATAIKETAKVGGAANVIGAGAKDIANGEMPSATKMIASGVIGTATSAIGAKIGTSTAAKFEKTC